MVEGAIDAGEQAVKDLAAAPVVRAPTPAEEFSLVIGKQGATRGFARRLYDGTLKPEEREAFAKMEQILLLREEGKSLDAIAAELQSSAQKIRQFTASQRARLMATYIRERQMAEGDKDAHQRAVLNRRRWDSFGPKALDYYDWAMRRHTRDDKAKKVKAGDPLDPDRYERAAKMVAEGQGWTAPVPVYAQPRELKPGIIQSQMQAIAAADRKETVVRVTVGDTTVEVGTRETATMGE